MACVLDTSAFIAFLKQETGWQHVAQALEGDVYLSTVNQAEFSTYMVRNGHTLENAHTILRKAELETVTFDQEQAAVAASLYPLTHRYGLSLGDRACLALAYVRAFPVITADQAWENLENPGIDIRLIR